ncbi:DUF1801 domain-containing protein [Agromyces seonyuensis]|uniref:YdhG-like domain-containing protein n=1 Tax=Agromyces seonyuensis TaxID=2662446 RepID=A0A6I4NUF7_9MICO|nr:DUF1801 domain-containing protein [Agromyces seonyuensis]MWB97910.1 hypothetical protein [Agromyces seonyuensis]
MERTGADVDAFLAEHERAAELEALDGLIRAELGGLERVLWEGPMWGGTFQRIVGYGAIEQPRPKGPPVQWFLVGLAAQRAHLSLYVNAADADGSLVRQFADRLGDVKIGAAAITFHRVADLDLAAFGDLLRRARALAPDAR